MNATRERPEAIDGPLVGASDVGPTIGGIRGSTELTPAQIGAVTDAAGLIALRSPPGTGKTRTLAERMATRIANSDDPYRNAGRHLMLTYTNRARAAFEDALRGALNAKGLREIAARVVAPRDRQRRALTEPRPLWVETFHSACARITRMHLAELGLRGQPTIMHDRECHALIELAGINVGTSVRDDVLNQLCARRIHDAREAWARVGVDAARDEPGQGRLKGGGTPAPINDAERATLREYGRLQDLYGRWSITDLPLQTFRLMRDHQAIRRAWQTHWGEIMVDEYQDTDLLLTGVLAYLATDATVIAAGDENQAIYGWREAIGSFEPLGLLERHHGRAVQHTLERNFRATEPLQAAAERLRTGGAETRRPVAGGDGPRPWAITVEGTIAAETALLRWIEWVEKNGPKDSTQRRTAVLTRTNEDAQNVALTLSRAGRKVWLGRSDRRGSHVELWLAWFAIATADHPTQHDVMRALSRVAERIDPLDTQRTMRRAGAGSGRIVERMTELVRDEVAQGTRERDDPLVRALAKATALRTRWGDTATATSPKTETTMGMRTCRIMNELSTTLRMEEILENHATMEQRQRWHHNMAQVHALCRMEPETGPRIVSELMGGERLDATSPPPGAIEIHTMHGAKGLEFDAVLAWDWTEGVFPRRSEPDPEDLHLAYVALTRARRVFTAISTVRTDDGTPLRRSRYLDRMGAGEARPPRTIDDDDPYHGEPE